LTKVARRCRSDARGYAPAPLALPFSDLPPTGHGRANQGDFALIRGGEAIVGPHVGDLEQAAALDDYRAMLGLYREIFAFMPAIVAVDAHAGYLSTQLGEALAAECGARLVRVAHHHAHMACALPITAWVGAHLGLLLDGLGLGPDGTLWGGEVLSGDYRGSNGSADLPPCPDRRGGGHARTLAQSPRPSASCFRADWRAGLSRFWRICPMRPDWAWPKA
jgi:hydrogenase maturation protein HypF